jgi:hypothetical protein
MVVKTDARNAVPPGEFERALTPWEYPMRGLRNRPYDRRQPFRTGEPEVSLNQKVKNLIQQLGEAIHESVSESEHIAGVVKNLREQGFDVLLMLEATIGLNEVESEEESEAASGPERGVLRLTAGESVDGPFTHNDLSFLKSLRISLPEGGAEQMSGD